MNRIVKKIISFVIVVIMLFAFLVPTTKVIATNYGSGSHFLNTEIGNELGFTINSVTVNGNNWKNAEDKYYTNDDKYHIEISVSGNETTGNKIPAIEYGGNWNKYIVPSSQHNGNNHTFVLDVTDSLHQEFLGLSIVEGDGSDPVPGGRDHNFDGNAYLIWSCSNGGVCYHHFTDIPNFDDGNSAFYKASEVKDTRTNEAFKVDARYKGWATDEMFEDWQTAYKIFHNIEGDIDWSKVNPEDIVGDPIDMRDYEQQAIAAGSCTTVNTPEDVFHDCVDEYVFYQGVWAIRARLQPLPDEPTDNNAYVSYGDRNFKVVIYNDKYKGVSLGDLSKLSYYPASYTNAFIRQDQFDISGTSKDNPTVIDSVLLEKTVTIKTLDYNSFDIASIEALDVPNDAVSINKTNGEWKIVFSSNYFDNVVFKVTDTNGKSEYFKIHRYTVQANLRFWDNKPTIVADFYFDRNRTYTDFVVTAKIIYKNGTTKNVDMTAVYGIDDGLGNMTYAYEVDEQDGQEFGNRGKGLKKSTFSYQLTQGEEETISKVYINVEYTGSTLSNYAGAFTGSGKGIEIDFGGEQ